MFGYDKPRIKPDWFSNGTAIVYLIINHFNYVTKLTVFPFPNGVSMYEKKVTNQKLIL